MKIMIMIGLITYMVPTYYVDFDQWRIQNFMLGGAKIKNEREAKTKKDVGSKIWEKFDFFR